MPAPSCDVSWGRLSEQLKEARELEARLDGAPSQGAEELLAIERELSALIRQVEEEPKGCFSTFDECEELVAVLKSLCARTLDNSLPDGTDKRVDLN